MKIGLCRAGSDDGASRPAADDGHVSLEGRLALRADGLDSQIRGMTPPGPLRLVRSPIADRGQGRIRPAIRERGEAQRGREPLHGVEGLALRLEAAPRPRPEVPFPTLGWERRESNRAACEDQIQERALDDSDQPPKLRLQGGRLLIDRSLEQSGHTEVAGGQAEKGIGRADIRDNRVAEGGEDLPLRLGEKDGAPSPRGIPPDYSA